MEVQKVNKEKYMKTFREFLLEDMRGRGRAGDANPMDYLAPAFPLDNFSLQLGSFDAKNLPNNYTVKADETGVLDKSHLKGIENDVDNRKEVAKFIFAFCSKYGYLLSINNEAAKKLFTPNPIELALANSKSIIKFVFPPKKMM